MDNHVSVMGLYAKAIYEPIGEQILETHEKVEKNFKRKKSKAYIEMLIKSGERPDTTES